MRRSEAAGAAGAAGAGRDGPFTDNNTNPGQGQNSNSNNVAGNANGQGVGANSAQVNVPQSQPQSTIRPVLTSRPQLLPSRSRTISASVDSETEARRMVRDSLEQQASAQAQARALRDSSWKNAMDNMVNLVSRAYTNSPGERTPSRSSSTDRDSSGKKDQQ